MVERVGVRALQQHASAVVRAAAQGDVVEVTDRGRLVARLVPASADPLTALVEAGHARPASRRIGELPAPLRAASSTAPLTALLEAARSDER
jgi:prevent-host-death family protein